MADSSLPSTPPRSVDHQPYVIQTFNSGVYLEVRVPDTCMPLIWSSHRTKTLSTTHMPILSRLRRLPPLFRHGNPTHSPIVLRMVSSAAAQDQGNFKLLKSFPIGYAPITVSKWRSEKTGLTVVLGSHQAPIVRTVLLCLSDNHG